MDEQLVNLALAPIAGPGLDGKDLEDDADYIKLSGEVSRFGRIGSEPPAWREVETCAKRVLCEKEKNLDTAVALGHALFRNEDYRGLATGLAILHGLVDQYWETLTPQRDKSKRARFDRFFNRFLDPSDTEDPWLEKTRPTEATVSAGALAVEKAEALAKALGEKLDASLMPQSLAKFISRLSAECNQVKAKQSTPNQSSGLQANNAATSSSSAGSGSGLTATTSGSTKEAYSNIQEACKFLFDSARNDPMPYVFWRIKRWQRAQLPAAGEARVNMPLPEGENIIGRLAELHGESKWQPLLNLAETSFRVAPPLWLDLQWYVCESMERLGTDYDLARHAIESLTVSFVIRLGDAVYDLKFKDDGGALCSEQARAWIESKSGGGGGGGGGITISESAALRSEEVAAAATSAHELARSGKVAEALTTLRAGLAKSLNFREQLYWKLEIARLCVEHGRLEVASSVLEECRAKCELHRLGDWEPEFATDAAHLLYKCYRGLSRREEKNGSEFRHKRDHAFDWLCQLDPSRALHETGG